MRIVFRHLLSHLSVSFIFKDNMEFNNAANEKDE